MEEAKEYCYSFDGEHFSGYDLSSVEEAIEESKTSYQYMDGESKYVYIGEPVLFKPCIDGGWVCEILQEQAIDECGECAEQYLEDAYGKHYDILEERLTKEFNKWAEEFGYTPNFYTVKNVTRYEYER